MEPASAPGAGSRLPAALPGEQGLVSPRATGVSPALRTRGAQGGRAQLRDHHVVPGDRDVPGDWSPQFGKPWLLRESRDLLRGPGHPKDTPALGGSLVVQGMSPGTRRGCGSVPRPEVTGIVSGCHRSSSGQRAAPPSLGMGPNGGGPHPPGGAGAGALHPIPQGIRQGAPRGRGISSPTLPSISLSSAMGSGWQLQNSLQREKTTTTTTKPPRKQHLLPKIPSLPAGTMGWKGEQTLPCWHQSKDWSPGQSLESFVAHHSALLSLSKSSRMSKN